MTAVDGIAVTTPRDGTMLTLAAYTLGRERPTAPAVCSQAALLGKS
jgi:hypothetical protein